MIGRREASAEVFQLALAGKLKEAFDHSRGVAAKHRQVAIGAVSKLIALNVEKMQAARDASVAMAAQTRAWLVIGASAADDLSRQADKLRANVNGFLGQIRAA